MKWEGGLSNNPKDLPPASDPVPDGSGNHTNKGVTWITFKSFAVALNYSPVIALWYQMPADLWGKIMKFGYWDKISGDQIQSQAIADIMQNWAFMSGAGTVVMKMQQFLGLNDDGHCGPLTLAAINSRSLKDDTEFADAFLAYNLKFFLSLTSKSAFFEGWTNRLNSLKLIVDGEALNHPTQLFPPHA